MDGYYLAVAKTPHMAVVASHRLHFHLPHLSHRQPPHLVPCLRIHQSGRSICGRPLKVTRPPKLKRIRREPTARDLGGMRITAFAGVKRAMR